LYCGLGVPEIWLNYGITDVVLDIRAENLDQNIDSEGKILEDSVIQEKLGKLITAQPLDDVSPLSRNRKLIYILVIVLAILCAPISQTPLS